MSVITAMWEVQVGGLQSEASSGQKQDPHWKITKGRRSRDAAPVVEHLPSKAWVHIPILETRGKCRRGRERSFCQIVCVYTYRHRCKLETKVLWTSTHAILHSTFISSPSPPLLYSSLLLYLILKENVGHNSLSRLQGSSNGLTPAIWRTLALGFPFIQKPTSLPRASHLKGRHYCFFSAHPNHTCHHHTHGQTFRPLGRKKLSSYWGPLFP
jgi:hypothetical protein